MVEEDGGGWGGGRRLMEEGGVERVFWRTQSTNGEKGGREEGGNHVFRARLSQMRGNLQTYPPFQISYITTILVG